MGGGTVPQPEYVKHEDEGQGGGIGRERPPPPNLLKKGACPPPLAPFRPLPSVKPPPRRLVHPKTHFNGYNLYLGDEGQKLQVLEGGLQGQWKKGRGGREGCGRRAEGRGRRGGSGGEGDGDGDGGGGGDGGEGG